MKPLLAALLLSASIGLAEEVTSRVRTSMNEVKERWVGQKATLVVELLAPGYFSGSPSFDLPRIPDVLIMPPAGSPSVSSEEIDGTSFTVQRHELVVIPRREGEVALPAFEVRFEIKRQPLDQDAVAQSVKTPPVSFTTRMPPGTAPGELVLTSKDLSVTETWKPEPGKSAKAGNAFVRTLTWSATDLPGMAFPPFKPQAAEGLGIYQSEPEVNDSDDRGVSHGGRVDRVTYVCKNGGQATIPGWSFRWWDPQTREMRHVEFPAHAIDVSGPPAVAAAPPESHWWKHHWRALTVWSLVVITAGTGLWLARERLADFLRKLLPHRLPPLNPGGSGDPCP